MVKIHLRLLVTNNRITIPNCEPASTLSSKTLSAYLAKSGCNNTVVDVNKALEAIPGSFIEYSINDRMGMRYKYFVLPGKDATCPCPENVDYYGILKSIAEYEYPAEEVYNPCDLVGLGFNPSPDFEVPQSTYIQEGHIVPEYLPPIPQWG